VLPEFQNSSHIFTKGNEVGSFDHFAVELLPSDFIGQMRKILEHLSQDDRLWTEVRKPGIRKMKSQI